MLEDKILINVVKTILPANTAKSKTGSDTTVYKNIVNRQSVSELICDLLKLRENNYNLRGNKIQK